MRKYTLSKSDSNEIMEFVNKKWSKNVLPEKLKNIQVIEVEENNCVLTTSDFFAVKVEKNILPLLTNENVLNSFPSVTIDMGAIRFICNGANVMRPGIVSTDEFNKDDIVVVKDNKHGKYLAVGIALVASKEVQTMLKGQVINNMHYVSDKFWKSYKENQ
ncbi:MAG: RNA-binding protein [Thaumarchaeota archaeon]|nr:RNA-binding protein [Nitrososphaerota archaeon]